MLDISVVICSHNPRPHYIGRVLDALRSQTLSKESWELLLIDNASKDPLSRTLDLSWHPNSRHILEPTLGLSHARECGIANSSARVIVFVDDDNVLDSDYLSEVIKISNDWPLLGAWGCGSAKPEFEVEPRADLQEFVHFLAAFEGKKLAWSNVISCQEALPCGVGLSIRSQVARAYVDSWKNSDFKILDRKGTSLLSSGDYEIAFTACSLGMGMAVFPQLKVTHLIPKERVTEDYFVRLREGIATSGNLLNYKWRKTVPQNYKSPMGVLKIIGNVLRLSGVQRRMYLAHVRAAIKARQMIAHAVSNKH